jgi:hypothetical protein
MFGALGFRERERQKQKEKEKVVKKAIEQILQADGESATPAATTSSATAAANNKGSSDASGQSVAGRVKADKK